MTDIFSHTALQTRFAAAALAQAVWPWDDRDRKRGPAALENRVTKSFDFLRKFLKTCQPAESSPR